MLETVVIRPHHLLVLGASLLWVMLVPSPLVRVGILPARQLARHQTRTISRHTFTLTGRLAPP